MSKKRIIMAVALLSSCGSEKNINDAMETNDKSDYLKDSQKIFEEKGIQFYVYDASSKGLKYVMINSSNKEYTYGGDYVILTNEKEPQKLEKRLDGEFSFSGVGIFLKAGEKIEEEVNWSSFIYGEIPEGKYIFKKHILLNEGGIVVDEFDVVDEFEVN